MPELHTELFDSVVGLLLPFMHTRGERRTELIPVVNATQVEKKIEWEGDPEEFTVRLVRLLSHDQLFSVLKRLKVGEEKRATRDEVAGQVDLLSKIESSGIATVGALLNRGKLREALVRLNDITQEFFPPHHPEFGKACKTNYFSARR